MALLMTSQMNSPESDILFVVAWMGILRVN